MAHVLEAEAVPACLDAVHELLDALWREAPAVDGDARARFATAVAELVANVVEHGSVAGASPHLELTVSVLPGSLLAVLVDDGLAVPDARLPADPVGELEEDGRGLLLVHLAADAVCYERRQGANRWELAVSLR